MKKEKYKINGYEYDAKKIIDRVKDYYKTPKGKKKRQDWLSKNKGKLKSYYKNYMKERRQLAKLEGICTSCFKNAVAKHLTCDTCRKNTLDKRIKRKKNEKSNN